jgi:transcriptional regulator with XRE-family HTH domain
MLPDKMPLTNGTPRFDQATIGRRIRDKRIEKGMTQAEVGKILGVGEDAVRKKEKGTSPFHFHELAKLGDLWGAPALYPVLDWDVAWFVERTLPPDIQARKTRNHKSE